MECYVPRKKNVSLATVVDKLIYNNLNLSKYIKTVPKNKKVKVNQVQSGNGNGKINNKGDKDRWVQQQDKWKKESPKEVDAQTKNMNSKENISDTKFQAEGVKV